MQESFQFVGQSPVAVRADGLIAKTRAIIGDNQVNTSYVLYVNGTSYLNGATTINGNLIFPAANILDWNGDTYRQRIVITDDNTTDTAVFTFQQSTNSGTSYTDLFTIKDNGTIVATNFDGNAATATSATTATYIQGIDQAATTIDIATTITNPSNGKIRYDYRINQNSTGLFPCASGTNTNAILTLSTATSTNYGHQLGFSSNGHLYHRTFVSEAFSNTKTWDEILDSVNYSLYALPLSGGTMNGDITLVSANSGLSQTSNKRIQWYTLNNNALSIQQAYIVASNDGKLGFNALGDIWIRPGDGTTMDTATKSLVITQSKIYSYTNQTHALGDTNHRFDGLYSTTGDFSGPVTITGSTSAAPLTLVGAASDYREGIRIKAYGSWSDIVLGGNDLTAANGITANSWFIGNNNGNFYITRNGSTSSSSAILKCVSNVWSISGTVDASISGNATTASSSKVLANTSGTYGIAQSTSSRPNTPDITHVPNGGVVHFKAASAMNSDPNKPMADGNILHFHWDTSSAWNSQLYIPDKSTGASMQWRGSTEADRWDSWRTLLDSNNYSSYALPADTVVNQVSQSSTNTDSWRKILLHHTYDDTSTTAVTSEVNVVYAAANVAVRPSTGAIRADIYNVSDKVQLQYNTTDDSLDFVFI